MTEREAAITPAMPACAAERPNLCHESAASPSGSRRRRSPGIWARRGASAQGAAALHSARHRHGHPLAQEQREDRANSYALAEAVDNDESTEGA